MFAFLIKILRISSQKGLHLTQNCKWCQNVWECGLWPAENLLPPMDKFSRRKVYYPVSSAGTLCIWWTPWNHWFWWSPPHVSFLTSACVFSNKQLSTSSIKTWRRLSSWHFIQSSRGKGHEFPSKTEDISSFKPNFFSYFKKNPDSKPDLWAAIWNWSGRDVLGPHACSVHHHAENVLGLMLLHPRVQGRGNVQVA